MAIYHLSAQVISRSANRSSVAAAAYRAGEAIEDRRLDAVHDYTDKTGIAHKEILMPAGAPVWMTDRAELWNRVEEFEKRCDAQVAREMNIALPKELDFEQSRELIREFVTEEFVKRGMVADLAMHMGDANNPHAHVMLTMRELSGDGFGRKQREWNDRKLLEHWRASWSLHCNRALERAGHEARIDHRTLEEQGIDRVPTVHLGPAADLEARGVVTEIGDRQRQILDINEVRELHRGREERIGRALGTLTQRASTFTEKDLARIVLKQAGDEHLGPDELRATVNHVWGRQDVVLLGEDSKGELRLTTTEMLALEKRMAESAKERQGTWSNRGVSVLDGSGLNAEQRKALAWATGKDGVAVIEGLAGTGKTSLLAAARRSWERTGVAVRGAALAGKAAQGLQEGAGIRSQTLHSLLDELRSGKTTLGGRDVVVVDEAGMIGSRQMAELLERAAEAQAKVVLVGDSRQLQPIDAGGAFRTLSNELGAARLTGIQRQKEEWARENVLSFAMGRSAVALKSFTERGLVTWSSDRQASAERLVKDWARGSSVEPQASQLMLAGTRAEVAQLNELARQSRLSTGELDKGVAVATSQGGREFSVGDRLLFLRNDKALGVKNGTLGTVESIRARGEFSELRVRTDQGQRVTVTTEQYNYIDHGYATTVHKAQGQTVDRAYVLLGRMHDRELSYVSASRARGETRLYADAERFPNQARLAQQMGVSHQKDTSRDYAAKPTPAPEAVAPKTAAVPESAEALSERMLGRFLAGLAQSVGITHRMIQAGELVQGILKSLTQLRGQLLAVVETRGPYGQPERVVAPVASTSKLTLETEAVLAPGRTPREFVLENKRVYDERVRELERGQKHQRQQGDFENER